MSWYYNTLLMSWPLIILAGHNIQNELKMYFPLFLAFCHTYESEIRHRLRTRRVQTNEVQRCAYLYPIFSKIQQQTKRPLGLLEIGTSAGLQLFVV